MAGREELLEWMRSDWNKWAREDAHYYVAFGRRGQEDDEFLTSGADVVRALQVELKRVPRARRALEIGCGPGRLIRPMSLHFEEIWGVDVSDDMVRLAQRRLADVPNARVSRTSGSDLSGFADEYFDFVYSYAVFQHIPSAEIVFEYLREARRVLRPGGILRCQINGLPPTAARYTTWEGVRISADQVADFAREYGFHLLALEGILTQYMWVTMRKPAGNPSAERQLVCRIRATSNAVSGESAIPASGRFAVASLWIESLPPAADINTLEVMIDGRQGRLSYIGSEALAQVNVALPEGVRTGLVPVEVRWLGQALATCSLRVIPAGPAVPRLTSVTDGVNLLSSSKVSSGSVKVAIEDVPTLAKFSVSVDDIRIERVDAFCTDPEAGRFEFNFDLPGGLVPGYHHLYITLGNRRFVPVPIEVA